MNSKFTNLTLFGAGILTTISSFLAHRGYLLPAACVGMVLMVKGASDKAQPGILAAAGLLAGVLTILINLDVVRHGAFANLLATIVILLVCAIALSKYFFRDRATGN